MNENKAARLAVVALLAGGVTAGHYLVDLHAGPIHDLLQRAYYIPIVLAGLWFGVRGGAGMAFAISLAYYPHAFHGWHGPHSFFFRMVEIVMYHAIGVLTGFLASRLSLALDAEKIARAEESQARESAQEAYARLRDKTEELFALEEQLRRADRMAALGRLSAGLAHEIRNPLASIQTSVEMLRDRSAEAGQNSSATEWTDDEGPLDLHGIILEETARLNQTVASFLDFARQEKTGSEEGGPSRCRVREALDKTLGLLARQMERQGVEVRARNVVDSSLEVALGEPLLRQVFLNLFLNALDAVGEGGWIRVEAEQAGGKVRVTVEDSGPGVRADMAERIFDPFYSTKEGGTGLGLAIVDRAVSSRGGRITLESDGGAPSSRFALTLPSPEDAQER